MDGQLRSRHKGYHLETQRQHKQKEDVKCHGHNIESPVRNHCAMRILTVRPSQKQKNGFVFAQKRGSHEPLFNLHKSSSFSESPIPAVSKAQMVTFIILETQGILRRSSFIEIGIHEIPGKTIPNRHLHQNLQKGFARTS